MKTKTETLVSALRALANDIQSPDGVANASIREAADRLEELDNTITAMVEVDGAQIKRMRAHNAELQRYNVGLAEENCKLRRELESVRLRDCERDAEVIKRFKKAALETAGLSAGCVQLSTSEEIHKTWIEFTDHYANQLRKQANGGA